MPRHYVDNAMNRSLGRVGMAHGTAVHSSSGSNSSMSRSSGLSQTYVDNSMNRSLGRVGLPHGTTVHSSGSNSSMSRSSASPPTYVDNSLNRSLGRVGMAHGTAVHSSSSNSSMSSSSASPQTYVDNSLNRSLGRVGMPHGTAVHSSSSGTPSSSSYSKQSSGTYVDNAYNRRLGRVGLPLGTVSVSSKSATRKYVDNVKNRGLGRVGKVIGTVPESSSTSSMEKRVYVDNALNRKLGRVGLPLGSAPHSSTPTQGLKKRVFEPLRQFDAETANLQNVIDRIMQQRQLALEDAELAEICDQAEGIVKRHEAALAEYHSNLKRPKWMNGGEIIDFADLEFGDELGKGGFGSVHVALWRKDNKLYQVAVKKLRVQRVSKAKKQQFEEEVKLFSTLHHPAIVEFYGACIETPNLAIVMEFMKAGSLYDVLHVEALQLEDKQKYQMVEDALSALSYLHDKSIAHRDIKSRNVLVCEDLTHCKLADFGQALKDDSDSSTSVAEYTVVGTARYSPPEVLEGQRLTLDKLKAADIYSVALTVAELLTEKEPFDGLNIHQLRRTVVGGERPSLDNAGIPKELQTLLSKGMSKVSFERPSASCFLTSFRICIA